MRWENTSTGIYVFRAGRSAAANPVFVIDEVDKIAGDPKFDPVGPLHTMLKESSAKYFEDESLPGIEMDASHIRWILTANETRSISAPSLSRVHVIHVPEMTETEAINVRARIFHGVVNSLGLPSTSIIRYRLRCLAAPVRWGHANSKSRARWRSGRRWTVGNTALPWLIFNQERRLRREKWGSRENRRRWLFQAAVDFVYVVDGELRIRFDAPRRKQVREERTHGF